ncbi:hypothetical protein [Dysgonomonas sp. 511]|uniref:hypothetical protein n=1 Tax=Dysgonomonas sp. 511 TaxID=2302930 RepID=UPI0013D3D919|nr:hypothetical protein [Dysgonomonas sp. 511]NDV79486.1 hypothetical protein [Dysgonomonas sp. 511]
MNYSNSISDVNCFLLEHSLLYIKEKVLFIDQDNIFINCEGYKISKFLEDIFIEFFSDDGFEKTIKISINNKHTPVYLSYLQRGEITKEGITVFLSYDEKYNTFLNIINIKLENVVWKQLRYTRYFFLINDQYILLYGENQLICVDFVKNVQTIDFSLSDFPPYINGFGQEQEVEVIHVMGIYKNILWIHMGDFRIIGLDIDTGKMVHHIEDLRILLGLGQEEKYYFNFSPFDKYSLHLDTQKGLLKGFAHRFYIDIDLNTLTGKVKKDFGEITKESWRIKNSLFYQEAPNLLYFSGSYKSIDNPNAFGIFDTQKAEIVWYETSKEEDQFFFNPPQANDKLLAILDSKQNLLIYEK